MGETRKRVPGADGCGWVCARHGQTTSLTMSTVTRRATAEEAAVDAIPRRAERRLRGVPHDYTGGLNRGPFLL